MVSWWVVALAVLFPLAQVPLVLWIGRYFALDDDEEPATPAVRERWTEHEASPATEGSPGQGQDRRFDPEEYDLPETPSGLDGVSTADDGPTHVRCPECGTENDTSFRFCGECAAEL